MNIMEKTFEISCIEILVMISKPAQLISICSTVNKNYEECILTGVFSSIMMQDWVR